MQALYFIYTIVLPLPLLLHSLKLKPHTEAHVWSPGGRPRFMTVSEVREVMRRMWAANAPLLALMYAHDAHPGRSAEAAQALQAPGGPAASAFRDAYHMFFLQVRAAAAAAALRCPCISLY
jgi:hypothetical protein